MNVVTNNDLQCTIALAALENVLDPEIGLNVVDLGLIYRLEFDEPGLGIAVAMTLSTPYCPMGESITAAVEQVLKETFTGISVTIELTFQPPWSYDRISEAGKIFLSR
ncbi:MAG TPA: metal-sulfur cluster assembly factor [Puia sp.]|nr:metal-sulfur cluster assembly factor [Puia sp.]